MSGKEFRFLISKISIILFLFLILIEIIVIMRVHLNEIIEMSLYVAQERLYMRPGVPIRFLDINYLFAMIAINLFAILELINPQCGRTKLYIKNGRLRRISIIIGGLFLFTFAIRIYQIVITL